MTDFSILFVNNQELEALKSLHSLGQLAPKDVVMGALAVRAQACKLSDVAVVRCLASLATSARSTRLPKLPITVLGLKADDQGDVTLLVRGGWGLGAGGWHNAPRAALADRYQPPFPPRR